MADSIITERWCPRCQTTPVNPQHVGEKKNPPVSIKEGSVKHFVEDERVEITVDRQRYKAYQAKEDEDELVIVLEPKG